MDFPQLPMQDRFSEALIRQMLDADFWTDGRHSSFTKTDKPFRDFYYRSFVDDRGERVAGKISGVLDGPLRVAADTIFNIQASLDEIEGSPVTIAEKVNGSPIIGPNGVICNEYFQVIDGGILYAQYINSVCKVPVDAGTVLVTFEDLEGPAYEERKTAIREKKGFHPWLPVFDTTFMAGVLVFTTDPENPDTTQVDYMASSNFDNGIVNYLSQIEWVVKTGAKKIFEVYNQLVQRSARAQQ